jgi:isoleucyl-tRNA synthetase
MPHTSADDKESIFLNQMPEKSGLEFSEEFIAKWDFIYSTREAVNKVLEEKRNEKLIGKSLEANIVFHCGDGLYDKYASLADELKDILIVSGVSVEKDGNDETPEIQVVKADGEKCERCWAYSNTVGTDSEHPTLCARCASVVK